MATVTRTPGPGRARLAAALKALHGMAGQVGWFESSKYPDGTPVAYVAAIQEFGYAPGGITPRMGLRAMAQDRQAFWAKVAEQGAKDILAGKSTIADVMELLGAVAEGDIRKQIASVTEPLLKDTTLEARARRMGLEDARYLTATGAKPLVDTGYLLATTTHIVVDSGSIKP